LEVERLWLDVFELTETVGQAGEHGLGAEGKIFSEIRKVCFSRIFD
jgi:hypothetical protein